MNRWRHGPRPRAGASLPATHRSWRSLISASRIATGLTCCASSASPARPGEGSTLIGRAGELDRIRGFERGCDDYLPKPFSYGELRGLISSTGLDGDSVDFKSRA